MPPFQWAEVLQIWRSNVLIIQFYIFFRFDQCNTLLMKNYLASRNRLYLLGLLLMGCLYFYFLPRYIQGGDTAELVMGARGLFVVHPPGYPLWVWLQWLWGKTLLFPTPFWGASFLTSLFALTTLAIATFPIRKKGLLAICCILSLGLSTSFFESSLLPDVFSLHALIVSAIAYLYLFLNRDSQLRVIGIPFIFMLGISHHLTIICLLPLVMQVFYETLADKKLLKKFVISLLIGIIVTTVLYLSMLTMHPNDYFSWAQLRNPQEVLKHFLRSDYGSLSLAPTQNQQSSFSDPFLYFFKTAGLQLSVLIALAVISNRGQLKTFKTVKFSVWVLSLILTLVFFFFVNFKMEAMGLEIIKRFHVMPAVLITMSCVYLFFNTEENTKRFQRLSLVSLIALLIIGYPNIDHFSSLRSDSVFEDYSKNLLEMAKKTKAKIIFSENDNSYFGTRYIQFQSRAYDEIAVASPPLFFHPWYLDKIKTKAPTFEINQKDKIWIKKELDILNDLILPNLNSMDMILTKNYDKTGSYNENILPLGRLVSLTKKEFTTQELNINVPSFQDFLGPQGFSKKLLYSEYAHYYLAMGMLHYQKNEKEQAKIFWKKALEIVPYCLPALKNLCSLDTYAANCSEENIQKIKFEAQDIF